MATEIKPPFRLSRSEYEATASIFLAGTIDMGSSEDWQARVVKELEAYDGLVFNPRRDNWDVSWEQTPINPEFRDQVLWEIQHLKLADVRVFYFADNSKSPVTMLELGAFITSSSAIKPVVYCSPKFYRYGNVKIFCELNDVVVHETYEDFILALKAKCSYANLLSFAKSIG